MEPNINGYSHPNESIKELDLSSSAAITFVCISAFFCLLLAFAYCRCYFSETRTEIRRLFRKRKPSSPLPLPVVSYRKTAEELTRGCVVCLNEFEDKEAVKVIPGCGHVFHPQCIDRWLVAHMSCPVCRCSRMFDGGERESAESNEAAAELEAEQVVVREMEGRGVRLERSRSWCYRDVDHGGERMGMRRTCSF